MSSAKKKRTKAVAPPFAQIAIGFTREDPSTTVDTLYALDKKGRVWLLVKGSGWAMIPNQASSRRVEFAT